MPPQHGVRVSQMATSLAALKTLHSFEYGLFGLFNN